MAVTMANNSGHCHQNSFGDKPAAASSSCNPRTSGRPPVSGGVACTRPRRAGCGTCGCGSGAGPAESGPPPTGGSSNVASTGGSRASAGRTSRVVCASSARSVAERESDAGDTGASPADGLDAAGHDGSAAGGVHSPMHTRAAGQTPGTG
eukprot:11228303-Lingulodinium_polyedra.AAC.3